MKRFFSVVGKGVGLIGRGLGVAGRATIALVGICGVVAALANYAMTQGSGTNFGSIVVSSVHYVQMLVCDPTTPSQCGAVSAGGAQKVDGSAVTQPVSVASSAVAPGAYQAGAFVAGAGADGWDVPEGHTTDTACPASGTATVVGCLRSAVNNPVTLGSASGGISTKTLAALSNTAIAVKAAAGQVYSAQCSNSDATHWAYIQIFNVAAASVTMGTTAPTKFVGIPPASNAGFTVSLVGDQYSTAISAGAASTSTGGTGPTTAIDCTVDFL